MSQKSGLLIVLNGCSSSGKTLTTQALAKLLEGDCLVTGLDELLERERPFGVEAVSALGKFLRIVRIMQFTITDGRLRLFKQLHREVAQQVVAGRNVLVETAMMEQRVLKDAAACFAPLHSYLIGMKPPLAVSEQWEAYRGDRPLGQARRHYELVHRHQVYDLVIDPSMMKPMECATTILAHVRQSAAMAFQQLHQDMP